MVDYQTKCGWNIASLETTLAEVVGLIESLTVCWRKGPLLVR